MWLGGDVSVMAGLVASGQAGLERVRPVIGYCGWSHSQLDLELRRGVWVRTHNVPAELSRRMWVVPPDSVHAIDQQRIATWRAALHGAGLPSLAEFPRGRAVDQILRSILHDHYRSTYASQKSL